jgi:hypothetical protein
MFVVGGAHRAGQRAGEQPPRRAVLALVGVDRAEQAAGHERARVAGEHLAADLLRPAPLAALAQHEREAAHAGAERRGVRVGATQLQRGVERLLGGRVVGRLVERHAEPLVELGGDGRQVVLEREREAVAHDRQARRVVAVLGARHPLDAHRPQAQVQPLGALGVGGGRARQLDRLTVAAGEPALVGDRDPLDRGVGGAAGRGERGRGGEARGGRRALVAAQLLHGGEPPLRVRDLLVGAGGGDQLAPGARGLGELARELAGRGVALERGGAPGVVVAGRPAVERQAAGLGGVAVGVDGLRLGGRAHERVAGARVVVRAQPVRRDLARRLAAALERLREGAVQRAPRHPRQVGVERLAHERGRERPGPVGLAHEPGLEQLGQRRVAGNLGHQSQVEARAGHGRGLDRPARAVGELGHADHHRVADRVRQRDLLRAGQLES